eukprot:s2878_g2.t1
MCHVPDYQIFHGNRLTIHFCSITCGEESGWVGWWDIVHTLVTGVLLWGWVKIGDPGPRILVTLWSSNLAMGRPKSGQTGSEWVLSSSRANSWDDPPRRLGLNH